jgi:hypothetical protein
MKCIHDRTVHPDRQQVRTVHRGRKWNVKLQQTRTYIEFMRPKPKAGFRILTWDFRHLQIDVLELYGHSVFKDVMSSSGKYCSTLLKKWACRDDASYWQVKHCANIPEEIGLQRWCVVLAGKTMRKIPEELYLQGWCVMSTGEDAATSLKTVSSATSLQEPEISHTLKATLTYVTACKPNCM